MGSSCDVEPYRARTDAAATAGGAQTLQLTAEPAVALRVMGRGKPPSVSVSGPGGRQIITEGRGRLKHNDFYYLKDPATNTTSILIAEPAPGTWTVRPLRGSSTVVSVAQTPVHPDPHVDARVTSTRSTRLLEFAADSDPGQRIVFWERGGRYEQELGDASGVPCPTNDRLRDMQAPKALDYHPRITCGVIPFVPVPGPGGVRHIVAVVNDANGEPVTEFEVASYHAPGEALPTRPARVRIARTSSTATITWSRSAGADDYDVDVSISDGRRLLDLAGAHRRHVVLRGVVRKLTITVKVAGVRVDDVSGPAAHAKSKGR
jgi:hypothetical protein